MRLFIAINFEEKITNYLLSLIESLKDKAYKGNFTKENNLHITLAFLGDVNNITNIKKAMDLNFKSFSIELGKIEERNGLVLLKIINNKELFDIKTQLDRKLKEENIWFDEKPFRPHITLTREIKGYETIPTKKLETKINYICLMESKRINGKLIYEEKHRVYLKEE